MRKVMKFVDLRSAKTMNVFEEEFVRIRCVGEVLCKGNFSHLQWKLNPIYAHNQNGPS